MESTNVRTVCNQAASFWLGVNSRVIRTALASLRDSGDQYKPGRLNCCNSAAHTGDATGGTYNKRASQLFRRIDISVIWRERSANYMRKGDGRNRRDGWIDT